MVVACVLNLYLINVFKLINGNVIDVTKGFPTAPKSRMERQVEGGNILNAVFATREVAIAA